MEAIHIVKTHRLIGDVSAFMQLLKFSLLTLGCFAPLFHRSRAARDKIQLAFVLQPSQVLFLLLAKAGSNGRSNLGQVCANLQRSWFILRACPFPRWHVSRFTPITGLS